MKKHIFALGVFVLAAALFSCKSTVTIENEVMKGYTDTETIATILARKSVREYEPGRAVEAEKVDLLLRAGMAAPSAMDRRPWELVVLDEREALDSLAARLPYAKMLAQAPMAIVVCGNVDRSAQNWFIDGSAVSENILLAAEALGLGAVWTGVYPDSVRAAAVAEALGLPANIVALNVIPIGYPAGENTPKEKYDAAKVHRNRW
jgi:nitroreductase